VFLGKLGSSISVTSNWLHICTLKSSQTRSKKFSLKNKKEKEKKNVTRLIADQQKA